MIAAGRGCAIVNVGSTWAHQAIAATPSSSYSVAKAGLHVLTENLAMEQSGVVVEPGHGTTGHTAGQRVFGLTHWIRDGSPVELAAVEARKLTPRRRHRPLRGGSAAAAR